MFYELPRIDLCIVVPCKFQRSSKQSSAMFSHVFLCEECLFGDLLQCGRFRIDLRFVWYCNLLLKTFRYDAKLPPGAFFIVFILIFSSLLFIYCLQAI